MKVTDDELRRALARVASKRSLVAQAAEGARDELARFGTEALMAGWTLREVADATGYSVSSVRRAKLDAHRRRAGWYPAVTREGWQQYWDGSAWVLEFRRPEASTEAGITSEASRRADSGLPPPDYNRTPPQQQQLPETTERHTP